MDVLFFNVYFVNKNDLLVSVNLYFIILGGRGCRDPTAAEIQKTRLAGRGTADPRPQHTILDPDCKDRKGTHGWGKTHFTNGFCPQKKTCIYHCFAHPWPWT